MDFDQDYIDRLHARDYPGLPPEDIAAGQQSVAEIKPSPTFLGQEVIGRIGAAAESVGVKLEDAMKIVAQEGNSPIKAAIFNFLVSDMLKSAGTALQDWTGTPRDATDEYPYRQLVTGKGMTTGIDPRIVDVAGTASAASGIASSAIKGLAKAANVASKETASIGRKITGGYEATRKSNSKSVGKQ